MKYSPDERQRQLDEIQLLEYRAHSLAREVAELRKLGKAEGVDYLCDSTKAIMMDKTYKFFNPLKPE
jgi:hypothetical protein